MNNHIQQDGPIIHKADALAAEALRQDAAFDTEQWQRYIEQEIGFILPNIQRKWLVNAVTQTALSYGLTILQLWKQLPINYELRQQFLDKVLIHESRFFRHQPSIEFVIECALQHQRRQLTNNSDDIATNELFRIWSVGCASGQETWSLAMSLAAKQLTNYTILGTDVSEQALKKARVGQYDKRQQALIPPHCQQYIQPLRPASVIKALRFFPVATNTKKTIENSVRAHWQVMPTLKQHVRFTLHNIINQEPPTPYLQQVIVCQNMLMYFRKFDQRDILARLSKQCALGGYIILAPGEALFWRPSNMRRIAHPQINAWQKISA
ncbi:chemotaxis protein methyltransferase CheR/type IV pilus assembly protein PilK [Psychrobacter luti]|uniref:Chemotaxis protein methyltransferase CheR/type IV pilus assembly protein PilK n=1 Tax=Psychrobacter luti TaxID=198481 RepID=A0A839TC82_9GAMM|nr:CheR family methyltransferase [Psychrobacter luti]MBB3106977.1 chemotaxis protein methyltransferase CheR/type IV pilus assembly protein PilK [Psychrobacter luti]